MDKPVSNSHFARAYRDVVREEQMSIEKFGVDYKHYMQKVPRMNLVLGIIRLLQQKKELEVNE